MGGRSAGRWIVAALLVSCVAAALWLASRDADDAPPRIDAPSTPKTAHVAPTKARRANPAVVAAPDAPHATLLVRVVAVSTRAPLAGAAVYVTDGAGDDWRAETSADGASRFDELAPGDVVVHAEAARRVSADRRVALPDGATENVELALDDAVAVEGSVVDADTGIAIPGAVVRLVHRGVGENS